MRVGRSTTSTSGVSIGSELHCIIVILFFLIGAGVWYLWRFVSIEYEYVIAQGEFEMEAIYGKRQRKKVMVAKIREMEIIAPAEKRYLDQAKRNEPAKTINASISIDDPSTYFCIYNDKSTGKKTMLYFSATKKAVAILKYYNPGATIVSDKLPI